MVFDQRLAAKEQHGVLWFTNRQCYSRFQNDLEVQHLKASALGSTPSPSSSSSRKHKKPHDPRKCKPGGTSRGWPPEEPEKPCRRSLKDRVLSRAFSEELESLMHAGNNNHHQLPLFDPRGRVIHLWNKVFLAACLVSLFVDPLFLYLTGTQQNMCIEFKHSLALTLSMIRSLLDVFYAVHIFLRFRTAFIAPSSRVFGRGELVILPYKIARRYLSSTFWFDLITALPLPQFVIWILVPMLKESATANRKDILRFSIIFQYLPRLFQIFPLTRQIVMATGAMTENAWASAAYNLILYMLASHVLGALWYLFSVQRQEACWRAACHLDGPMCQTEFFDCNTVSNNRTIWYQLSNITSLCTPSNSFYQFGIYGEALDQKLTTSAFTQKYFYCFWWGLKNLRTESGDELVHRRDKLRDRHRRSWAGAVRPAHWQYAILPPSDDDPAGRVADQADGHGAVDAPPSDPAAAKAVRASVPAVHVGGHPGRGRGGLAQGPPHGHPPGHQAPPLPGPGPQSSPLRRDGRAHARGHLRAAAAGALHARHAAGARARPRGLHALHHPGLPGLVHHAGRAVRVLQLVPHRGRRVLRGGAADLGAGPKAVGVLAPVHAHREGGLRGRGVRARGGGFKVRGVAVPALAQREDPA
ncbi:protein CNGC15a isoform X6 [Brachypodium distachyon]|uniref:protein CNGC15a isoform X6 n=1 Tax=Brachypodium distachyon TaxID=15368 RepID=UPI00052FED13|nr:protein CNGC15a isoform X6 [Brachypodium distachyon]|eukprot:XP_010235734.1 protein CNGC15a isoform X6 [Brachypodium distachyon]